MSKGVQDYFKDTYGRKTHFIPNGVNRPEIRQAKLITEKFGLTKDSYILFLGRLVPEKGIRYLVEVFKKIDTDKKLVIAGGSSDTDSFMQELKTMSKDDNRIIFTGFVQGEMSFNQLLAQPFQPLLLKSYSDGNKNKLVSELKLSMKLTSLFSSIVFAAFFSLGKVFYALWIPGQDIDLIYVLTVITMLSSVIEGPVYPL